ncbi:hypothetical protein AMTR_s00110p00093580 [Amborella trichopoda]|uniref:Uncharacterized protein n=1 Tax=Amborella trichopoda TaxID=13333 RepID=W1NXB4_AMBTC|nr:hypothetical protein AMTR_s00110p00093580 [Amborella trichopoda]
MMSSSFKSENAYSVDVDELLELGILCQELRKENDILRESLLLEQSKNGEVIKRLESELKELHDAHSEDMMHIGSLESELRTCSRKIGYLQDQLNLKNVEASYVAEHIHSLELKLVEAAKLHEKVTYLREELEKSDSERLALMEELELKKKELENSAFHIENLEVIISSLTLESQCEIESIRHELVACEAKYTEVKVSNENAAKETAGMADLIKLYKEQFKEAKQMITSLEKENITLQEKLANCEKTTVLFCHKVETHLDQLLKGQIRLPMLGFNQSMANLLENELTVEKEISTGEETLLPILSKLSIIDASDECLDDELEKMSHQIRESQLLIEQLREELRKEKARAKEDAEDLTQEMAEMRYQVMGMLEEECSRRACIEQASLHRIEELEAQVRKEEMRSQAAEICCREAEKLAEDRSKEVENLKNVLAGLQRDGGTQKAEACSSEDCLRVEKPSSPSEELAGDESKITSNKDNEDQAIVAWCKEDPEPLYDERETIFRDPVFREQGH